MEKERTFDVVMDMAKISPGIDEQGETKDTNFVFVKDNYFTLLGDMGLQGVGIECVRTAQARTGWPPKPIAEINDKRFNTLHHYNDNNSFHIFH